MTRRRPSVIACKLPIPIKVVGAVGRLAGPISTMSLHQGFIKGWYVFTYWGNRDVKSQALSTHEMRAAVDSIV